MLYVVAIFLGIRNTFDLRKLLHQNGFTIYIFNRLSGEISKVLENYETEEKILRLDSSFYQFQCVFNSLSDFPNQEVFKAIATHPGVKNFTIERRYYGNE
jgi:hypothetical protein